MNKLFLMLAIVLVSMLALSCDPPKEDSKNIEFSAEILEATTKATLTGFENGDEILVSAKNSSAVNAVTKYAYNDGKFISTTPFKASEARVNYEAFYPSTVNGSGQFTFTVMADQSTMENFTKSDLLVAMTEETSSSTPKLSFYHKLTAVTVNLSGDVEEGAKVTVNALGEVEVNTMSNTYLAKGSLMKVTSYNSGNNSFRAIIAPQTIEPGTEFISIEMGGKTYTQVTKEAVAIDNGSQYIINAIIKDGAVTFEASINPWGKPSSGGQLEAVTVSEATSEAVLVSVDVAADFTGTYGIFPLPASEVAAAGGDIEKVAQAFITADIAQWSTDYTVADNEYVFSGDVKDFNLLDFWDIPAGQDFYLIAVGADANGILNTNLVSVMFKIDSNLGITVDDVKFPNVSFGEITISNLTHNYAAYTTTPLDSDMTYLTFYSPTTAFDAHESDEARYISDLEYLQAYLASNGYTLKEGLKLVVSQGVGEGEAENLKENTSYTVYSYGIDTETLMPLSKVQRESFVTTTYVEPTGELGSVTVSEITETDALVTNDAGDFTGIYYSFPVTQTQFETDFGSDYQKVADDMIAYDQFWDTDFTKADNVYLFSGNQTWRLSDGWTIQPGTEYFILSFGVTPDGKVNTEFVVSENFTTVAITDFTIDITVTDITDTGAIITTTPSVDGIKYVNDFMTKAEADTMTEEQIANYFLESYGMFIAYLLSEGEVTMDYAGEFKAGTEYTIVTFSYNTATGEVGELFTKTFKTTGTYVPPLTLPDETIVPDVEFGKVELVQTFAAGVEFKTIPDNKEYVYFVEVGSTAAIPTSWTDAQIIRYDLNYFWTLSQDYRSDFGDMLARNITTKGDMEYNIPDRLSPDTEYMVRAYAVDVTTAQPLTKVGRLVFTTDASATPIISSIEDRTISLDYEIAPRSEEKLFLDSRMDRIENAKTNNTRKTKDYAGSSFKLYGSTNQNLSDIEEESQMISLTIEQNFNFKKDIK